MIWASIPTPNHSKYTTKITDFYLSRNTRSAATGSARTGVGGREGGRRGPAVAGAGAAASRPSPRRRFGREGRGEGREMEGRQREGGAEAGERTARGFASSLRRDAFLRFGSDGMQNASSVWVIRWRMFLLPKHCARPIFRFG